MSHLIRLEAFRGLASEGFCPHAWLLTCDFVSTIIPQCPSRQPGPRREWLLANHLKTCGGMRNYLLRWFCKAQSFEALHAPGRQPPVSGPEPRTLEEA
jgi:hypothetical protein